MARKNLLSDLMQGTERSPAPAQPRRSSGAIGAVSQSLASLKSRALIEVPCDMIDDAGIDDRLEADAEGIEALRQSIEKYGQQVPVMLRHSPNVEGRFEIVYGRRRVAAMKLLGEPVRAMVRDLNDLDLIVAQGQENTARKDLSFIEKARFARQMEDSNYDRVVIGDALNLDKTELSRMLSVIRTIPDEIVRAIGAAPATGRPRWMALAKRIGDRAPVDVAALAKGDTSDERFMAVFDALATPPAPSPAPRPLSGADGTPLGEVSRKGRRTVLTLNTTDGFDTWLVENFERLHREYGAVRNED